jgi:hypothetical protein
MLDSDQGGRAIGGGHDDSQQGGEPRPCLARKRAIAVGAEVLLDLFDKIDHDCP